MTRRDLVILGAIALATRLVAAILIGEPPYLDPAYYELVGRRLVAGDGFTTPALWSFLEVGGRLPADPVLPLPSNGHWMPLTSVIAAASMSVLGTSRLAAELPMIVAGAALVPLTAAVGWEIWQSRRIALISGILALFAGPMLVFVPLVDSFAIFGLAGFSAIYAAMRALRGQGGTRWMVLSGLCVGLATLTRIDGLLLAAAPSTTWLVRRGIGPWRVSVPRLAWGAALACAAAGIAVVAPWLARQYLVFGTPFPSAGGHTLWITSFNEQFSIGHPVDLGTYLASGPLAIVGSKLASWGLLIGRTAVLLGGVFVFSLAYGMWRERRRAILAPFLVYWTLLFLIMGGLFTLHAPMGAWYHSAWAWLPFALPLAVASFAPGVAALGRWIPIFSRERNQRFLMNAALAGAVVLSLVGSTGLVLDWRAGESRLGSAAEFLGTAANPGDVVMYVNPPALTLRTGLRSVAPPFDPYPVIAEVAEAYGARWMIVERGGETGDALGLWEGGAARDAEGNRAAFLAVEPAFETAEVRVFEVIP